MLRRSLLVGLFTLVNGVIYSQQVHLRSAREGLRIIHGRDVSKEEIMEYLLFEDGRDSDVDVIRFDNVGWVLGGKGPLIISSKLPIRIDSLGLIPLKLQVDSLRRLVKLIAQLNTGEHKNVLKRIEADPTKNQIFRITYRMNGNLEQYFVTSLEECTSYFKRLESCLKSMRNEEPLQMLYQFLVSSELVVIAKDGPRWKY